MRGFFTELAQLFIIGLDKRKQKGPSFQTFLRLLLLFLTLSMDHLEFKSNWLWKKTLESKKIHKRV